MFLPAILADRWRRLNSLFWIQRADTGQTLKFAANGTQTALYRNLHHRNIILKARQHGISTFIMLLMLDTMLFTPAQSCGVVAHKRDAASDLMRKKIKFARDRLPEPLRPKSLIDNETAVSFKNESQIVIDTSLRSGTYQILHISEYGDISQRRPDMAKEIRAGALNTVAPNCFIFIESTNKGLGGEFQEMCQIAMKHQAAGKKLTPLDYKFHFFGWYLEPRYVVNPEGIVIPKERQEYFEELHKKHNIRLSDAQRAWYTIKAEEQGDNMNTEFPSTPEEAFQASSDGKYFSRQMHQVRKSGRIAAVPHDPMRLVHTAWDIWTTAIWFFQINGAEFRMIRYEEGPLQGGLEHYAGMLRQWRDDYGYHYGTHLGPHDLNSPDLNTGERRADFARNLGLQFTVLDRTPDKLLSIEKARQVLSFCVFDERHCAAGIKCLDEYEKKWNRAFGRHEALPGDSVYNHGADAFQTFASGISFVNDNFLIYNPEKTPKRRRKPQNRQPVRF